MRKSALLGLFAISIISCQNSKNRNESEQNIDTTVAGTHDSAQHITDATDTSGYCWNETDQKKFLRDCRNNLAGKTDSVQLEKFCSCMLTQSQKYYPDYQQMEKNSNEEYDKKISLDCLENYPGDDDDDQ